MSNTPGLPSASDPRERHLRIGSARNLRDVGGYRVCGSGFTRWRTLFRSDSLHELSPADQARLAACGVRTAIDMRSLSEVRATSNRLVQSAVVRYVHVPFGRSPLVAPTTAELYRLALRSRQPELRTVFGLLARKGVLPAVLQCSAGKDRTGLVVALILAVLGVPAHIIAEDYALSTERQSGRSVPISPGPILDTLADVRTGFGGIHQYIRAIGVTDRELGALTTALVQ